MYGFKIFDFATSTLLINEKKGIKNMRQFTMKFIASLLSILLVIMSLPESVFAIDFGAEFSTSTNSVLPSG